MRRVAVSALTLLLPGALCSVEFWPEGSKPANGGLASTYRRLTQRGNRVPRTLARLRRTDPAERELRADVHLANFVKTGLRSSDASTMTAGTTQHGGLSLSSGSWRKMSYQLHDELQECEGKLQTTHTVVKTTMKKLEAKQQAFAAGRAAFCKTYNEEPSQKLTEAMHKEREEHFLRMSAENAMHNLQGGMNTSEHHLADALRKLQAEHAQRMLDQGGMNVTLKKIRHDVQVAFELERTKRVETEGRLSEAMANLARERQQRASVEENIRTIEQGVNLTTERFARDASAAFNSEHTKRVYAEEELAHERSEQDTERAKENEVGKGLATERSMFASEHTKLEKAEKALAKERSEREWEKSRRAQVEDELTREKSLRTSVETRMHQIEHVLALHVNGTTHSNQTSKTLDLEHARRLEAEHRLSEAARGRVDAEHQLSQALRKLTEADRLRAKVAAERDAALAELAKLKAPLKHPKGAKADIVLPYPSELAKLRHQASNHTAVVSAASSHPELEHQQSAPHNQSGAAVAHTDAKLGTIIWDMQKARARLGPKAAHKDVLRFERLRSKLENTAAHLEEQGAEVVHALFQELGSAAVELEAALAEARLKSQELNATRAELSGMTAKYNELRTSTKEAVKAANQKTNVMEHLNEEHAELKKAIRKIEETHAELEKKDRELDSMMQELGNVQNTSGELNATRAMLAAQIRELSTTRAMLAVVTADARDAKAARAVAEAKEVELEKFREQASGEAAELRRAAKDLEKMVFKAREELVNTSRDRDQVRARLDAKDTQLNETKSQLSAQLKETKSELSAELKETKSELSAQLNKTKSQLSFKEAELEEVHTSLEKMNATLARHARDEQAVHEIRDKVGRVTAELRRAREELVNSSQDRDEIRARLDAKEAQLNKTKSQLSFKEAEIKEVHSSLQKIRTTLERHVRDARAELKAKMDDADKELNSTRAQLAKKEMEMEKLRAQADEAAREASEARELREKEASSVVEAATELSKAREELNRDLTAAREELNRTRAQLAAHEEAEDKELQEARGEVGKLRLRVKADATAASDARTELEELRRKLKRYKEAQLNQTVHAKDLEVELNQTRAEAGQELKQTRAEADLELNQTRAELNRAEQERKRSKTELSEARLLLGTKDQELSQLHLKAAEDVANALWYKDEVARLRSHNHELEAALGKVRETGHDAVAAFNKTLRSLEGAKEDAADAQKMASAEKEELTRLRQELEARTQGFHSMQKTNEQLEAEMVSLRKTSQSELAAAMKHVKAAAAVSEMASQDKEELTRLRQELEARSQDFNSMQKTNQKLQAEMASMRNASQSELAAAMEHVKELTETRERLEKTGETLRLTLAAEGQELDATQTQVRRLKAEVAAAQRRAEDLKVQGQAALKSMRAQMEAAERRAEDDANHSATNMTSELNDTRAELRRMRAEMAAAEQRAEEVTTQARLELRHLREQMEEAERNMEAAEARAQAANANATAARKELSAVKEETLHNLESQVAKAASLVQKDAGLLRACHSRETELGTKLDARSQELAGAQSDHQLLLDQNEALLEVVRKLRGGESGDSVQAGADEHNSELLRQCRAHESELKRSLEADHELRKLDAQKTRKRVADFAKKYIAMARELGEAHREQKNLLAENEQDEDMLGPESED